MGWCAHAHVCFIVVKKQKCRVVASHCAQVGHGHQAPLLVTWLSLWAKTTPLLRSNSGRWPNLDGHQLGTSSTEPDVFEMPDADKLHAVICDHIMRMNIRASPGFDIISAPFIKHSLQVVRVDASIRQ